MFKLLVTTIDNKWLATEAHDENIRAVIKTYKDKPAQFKEIVVKNIDDIHIGFPAPPPLCQCRFCVFPDDDEPPQRQPVYRARLRVIEKEQELLPAFISPDVSIAKYEWVEEGVLYNED